MSPQNAPDDDLEPPPPLPSGNLRTDAPCFQCGARVAKRIQFTWWGGLLGPRLLHHVECGGCGQPINAKTGGSNQRAITIYLIVSGVIAVALVLSLVWFVFSMFESATPRR